MVLNRIKYLLCRRDFETIEEFNKRMKFHKLSKKNNIIKIKHFHPDGEKFPETGSYFQKGGFMGDCVKNSKSFDTNVEKGGIIVFDTTVHLLLHRAEPLLLSKYGNVFEIDKKVNEFNNLNKSGECIGTFSIGNYFKGRYICEDGKIYNEKSISIEIDGISSEILIEFAGNIAKEFMQRHCGLDPQSPKTTEDSDFRLNDGVKGRSVGLAVALPETVLVKDLNLDKIYLVKNFAHK